MKNICLSLAILFAVTACANRENVSPMPTISDQAKASLGRPVNCGTADSDIKLLESERASTAKQILSGVRMVFPIAAVAGLITGDYSDRVKVTTGEYNHAIEIKIDQIKSQCNL